MLIVSNPFLPPLLLFTAMFEHTHPAYQHWLQWGNEVRTLHEQGLIRGLIFVSAHWQAEDLRQGVYGTYPPV